ncbi:MAG: DoxX family protein [Mycobacteriales bacterium]
MPRLRAASPYLLAGLMTVTGFLHFAFPRPYDGIIPSVLPGPPRLWTYASGLLEWACAAGVAHPATRRRAGTATAVLFVAVFPANIEQAVQTHGAGRWIAYARLPLQVPLVLWALQVRRASAAVVRSASPDRSR